MLKITTWNVNGIRARREQVLSWLELEQPDVLCLQEVKAAREKVPPELRELPGYASYFHGHGGYSGVALLFKRSTFSPIPSFSHPEFDRETRIVLARAGDITFASIYVPNGGKDFGAKVRFLDALDALAQRAQEAGEKLILCGDLNVTREPRDVHESLRNAEQIGQTSDERMQLARLIGRDLVDLSRQFEPENDHLYTWWAPWRNSRARNIGWRLDYILCSLSLAKHAVTCTHHREFGTSDHGPVQAVFDIRIPRSDSEDESDPPEVSTNNVPAQLSLF